MLTVQVMANTTGKTTTLYDTVAITINISPKTVYNRFLLRTPISSFSTMHQDQYLSEI